MQLPSEGSFKADLLYESSSSDDVEEPRKSITAEGLADEELAKISSTAGGNASGSLGSSGSQSAASN